MVGDESPQRFLKDNTLAGFETLEKSEGKQCEPDSSVSANPTLKAVRSPANPRVNEAARWLAHHRALTTGNVIVELRRRFALTVMEATEAAKLGHQLQYGGGNV